MNGMHPPQPPQPRGAHLRMPPTTHYYGDYSEKSCIGTELVQTPFLAISPPTTPQGGC